jgi:glycosyltransferase involved in cell wall biosynthesis
MLLVPGLVTTILPVYNRPAELRESAASVLAQTYRPIELLIINDGSTDETGVVADEIAAQHPDIVRVIHQKNTGVGLAREAGRLAARGEFIQHLDSDDVLYPRKFELQVAGLREHPECGASYVRTRAIIDDVVQPTPERRTGDRVETMFPMMLQLRWWATIAPLYRAEIIHRAGAWLPLRNEEDWEYDARIAAQGVRLHHCAEELAEMRHHGRERLSKFGMHPDVLRDRARAHELILRHAQSAGIGPNVPEMKHYARELFLLARQCGNAGLPAESKVLFDLAREASGSRRNHVQFLLYAAAARVFGWSLTGRIACYMDHFR